jgi:serine/threonine protein kinase
LSGSPGAIASAANLASALARASMAPTEATPLTMEGTLLGTLPYMAPEQLEGRDADARTDIFSFGAVLYEMVPGQRAFQGKSQVSVMAAIIDYDPPPPSMLASAGGQRQHGRHLDAARD